MTLDVERLLRPCKGTVNQLLVDYAGEDDHRTVCGHPEGEHGPNGCRRIVGDGCDIGMEHGPIYCRCERYEAPD